MRVPVTRKMLGDWAGDEAVRDAESLVARGLVLEAAYEPPLIRGAVLWNNRQLQTSLKLHPDGTVENLCPCYNNRERGLICAHVIALGLTLVHRATDPERDTKYREELRRASRLACVDESRYIRRASAGTAGALPAAVRVTLDADWEAGCRKGAVPVSCAAVFRDRSVPLDAVPAETVLALDKQDEALLYVLDDISEGPARGRLELSRTDFVNIIGLNEGRALACEGRAAIMVNKTPVTTHLQLDLDRENGELILIAHTELPFMKSGEFPVYIVSGRCGWVYGAGNLWPLRNVLPAPYHPLYDDPVIISRSDVIRFFKHELPVFAGHVRIESDVTEDLFSVEPDNPRFHLAVRGSPASLSAVLYAGYGDLQLVAGKPDAREHFAIPDPEDLLRYRVRNLPAERKALELLAAAGLPGACGDDLGSIVGKRLVLNFLGSTIPSLRRRGWRVDLEGRVAPLMASLDFATPVVHIRDSEGADWFDVGFDFEDVRGASLSPAEIQLALRKGDSFVETRGRTVLLDADAIESMQGVFSDCATGEGSAPGHFRMPSVYAAFVKSSLDSLDGIDVEESAAWRDRASHMNRTAEMRPVKLEEPLDTCLRAYQKEGVSWLRFLEVNGFCGLLADEMGLGKTIQTLVWLQLARHHQAARRKPALVVCPTSLVDNWAEEAARFVPALGVLALTGAARHDKWDALPAADLVITSYALLWRDLDRYLRHEFSAAILDEAQHIKNRSTRNAVAAKQIRAHCRLVLTGTPIENSVSDLWSIMDFLMPGYLGSHETFRHAYELPIGRMDPDGEIAQAKLRKKLRPFLLRRLKTEVARDLPPKIERISSCALTPDQRLVYNEVLETSRRRLSGMVAKQGFHRSRMEVLATLMRLRQVCCHLGLLKLPGLKAKYPSAKLDLFIELLDEALDGGHRVLVFSQFVSMLHILRDELAKRKLSFCYLDGSTRDRLKIVHTFNAQRDIPVFLISLKAGGTGLNLTGADMVIHFDPWWNPAVEDQATDRAYRIGQKRTVYGIKLITKGTVEEKVLELQRRKRAVINATVESDEKTVERLTWEDVQELLSL